MPRYTGLEANWESFRRWLVARLRALGTDDFLVLTVPDEGYVQFINEGGNLLGECSDPAVFLGRPATSEYREDVLSLGWGNQDGRSGSPNFRALWYPSYVPDPRPASPWTPDLEDAVDAADLAVRTLREVFGAADPRGVELDGGQSMTVSSLDAELGTLFSADGD